MRLKLTLLITIIAFVTAIIVLITEGVKLYRELITPTPTAVVVTPTATHTRALATAIVSPTLIAATILSTAIITPSPSPTLDVATPPVPIANPFCPRPLNLELKYPSNGSAVSGVLQIRGTAKPRSQGEWYSLFYRVGIIREEMDYQIQNRVPRNRTTSVGGNIPIEFFAFTANVPAIADGVLGTWDTTTLPASWYSLRLWLRETDSQFLACDVYVFVRK